MSLSNRSGWQRDKISSLQSLRVSAGKTYIKTPAVYHSVAAKTIFLMSRKPNSAFNKASNIVAVHRTNRHNLNNDGLSSSFNGGNGNPPSSVRGTKNGDSNFHVYATGARILVGKYSGSDPRSNIIGTAKISEIIRLRKVRAVNASLQTLDEKISSKYLANRSFPDEHYGRLLERYQENIKNKSMDGDPHFFREHGAQTKLEKHKDRVNNNGNESLNSQTKIRAPRAAARFLSHRLQYEVMKKALKQYQLERHLHTNEKTYTIKIKLDEYVGEGYYRGKTDLTATKEACVKFNKNGVPFTAYPELP